MTTAGDFRPQAFAAATISSNLSTQTQKRHAHTHSHTETDIDIDIDIDVDTHPHTHAITSYRGVRKPRKTMETRWAARESIDISFQTWGY